jgi:hypothetical protein
VVVGKLLDVILDQAVDIPFEHRTGDVESEFLRDVFIDLLRVRRAAHAFDTQEFEVALFQVVKAMARDCVVDASEFWHETGGRGRRHCG